MSGTPIEDLEVERRLLRLHQPLRTAHGPVREREVLIVRLHAGDLCGLGEASPLPGYDTEALEETEAALRGPARNAVSGHEPGPGALAALENLPPHARAAMETALLDLVAQASALPLWQVLAPAAEPGPLALNATIGATEPGEAARAAADAAARGFRTVKVKADGGDDVERVCAVRDAVGAGVRIRVDANGAWQPDRALEALKALDPLAVELVEEPLRDATPQSMAALRARSPLPLAADESAGSPERARALLEAGAIDALVIKVGRLGGPRAALALALHAPAVILTSNLDGPVGVASAAHVALAAGPSAGRFAHGLATGELFEGRAPAKPDLAVPVEPGLGPLAS